MTIRMTTCRIRRRRGPQVGATAFLAMVFGTVMTLPIAAQPPRAHYLHHEYLPPGVIGQQQLLRHPGMPGYVQAVEVIAPSGTHVTFLQHGAMSEAIPAPVLAGMEVGSVYSLKLSQLPNRPGVELFPTVEVINRLFPPQGVKTRFPVPIHISEEDISQALSGLFVTRIVYMEDPETALPRADEPGDQRSINVGPHEDPLHVADRLGRPMAIIRIGSRVPDEAELSASGYPSPPVQIYPTPRQPEQLPAVKGAIERSEGDIPRTPEPTPRAALLYQGQMLLR